MATGEARAAAPRDKIAEAHTPKEEESDESARSAGADGGAGDEASSVHDQKARMARWRGEDEMSRLARAFFSAATKESTDNEDILPQEDSDEVQLSVFNVFATCFPEAVGPGGAGGASLFPSDSAGVAKRLCPHAILRGTNPGIHLLVPVSEKGRDSENIQN